MKRSFSSTCFAGLLAVCILLPGGFVSGTVYGVPPKDGPAPYADLVMGADRKDQGHVPAVFPHDAHAKTVQDCGACHLAPMEGAKPFAFVVNGKEATSRSATDNGFHDGCLTCHVSRDAGPEAGQCATCHTPHTATPLFKPRFDNTLHALHTASPFILASEDQNSRVRAENCAVCHHPNTEGLVEPTSCRACHGSGSAPAYRTTAHSTCVTCHETTLRSGNPSGPVTCAGCHDRAVFAASIQKMPAPKPIAAGQPVSVFMKGDSMTGVPFNHALHEKNLPSCSVCHHQGLQACGTCHVSGKTDAGKTPTAFTAMHKGDSTRSCVGCHEQRRLQYPECAGCHAMLPGQPASTVSRNCAFCHRPVAEALAPATTAPATTVPDSAAPDRTVSESAQPGTATRPVPPETVTIDRLSREFGPVTLPHAAIIDSLQQGIRTAAPGLLSAHAQTATCTACHHRAPLHAENQPPSCVSCHRPAAPGVAGAVSGPPALQQAYHQQCMGCHERMRVAPAPTDCAGCHTPMN